MTPTDQTNDDFDAFFADIPEALRRPRTAEEQEREIERMLESLDFAPPTDRSSETGVHIVPDRGAITPKIRAAAPLLANDKKSEAEELSSTASIVGSASTSVISTALRLTSGSRSTVVSLPVAARAWRTLRPKTKPLMYQVILDEAGTSYPFTLNFDHELVLRARETKKTFSTYCGSSSSPRGEHGYQGSVLVCNRGFSKRSLPPPRLCRSQR
jgi:hypothetical protein